jgi:hypothetical protein
MENPPRAPSEKGCMFCRRKLAPGGCQPYEEWRLRLLGLRFSDLDVDVSEAPLLEEGDDSAAPRLSCCSTRTASSAGWTRITTPRSKTRSAAATPADEGCSRRPQGSAGQVETRRNRD